MSASTSDFSTQSIAKREHSSPRYAIYFVPAADSSLYRFGAEFLGYDCYSGALTTKPSWCGLPEAEWQRVASEPRKYGFHATLKAPFHLVPSSSIEDLVLSLGDFVRELRPIPMHELEVEHLSSFVALTSRSPEIHRLAEQCVRGLDTFRTPISEDERKRRLRAGPTARQTENIERWGYPYVFEDFRFHMTLTGPVAQTALDPLLKQLREAFSRQVDPSGCVLDRIALVGQDSPASTFRVLRSWQLSSA